MEQLKQIFVEYWPTMLEYAMMFIAYFLVFLYKSKIANTKDNLTLLFKDKVKRISDENTTLRTDINAELLEAKAKYAAAVNKIESLEAGLARANAVINILVEDSEVNKNDE